MQIIVANGSTGRSAQNLPLLLAHCALRPMADRAEPSVDKKRRYDRQLRIWGEQGQSRLESARVCLLHCGPTGTEALKNLVLGGIAAFTLVDGGKVTRADLGNKCVALSRTARVRGRG